MPDLLTDLFLDYTLRTIALGTMILGIVSASLGSIALLRRQSLLGDAISHAALPGVAVAFMLTGSKSSLVLMVGAAVAGLLATLLMLVITRYTRIKEDTSLGIILSVFFGVGLMLLTFLQSNPDARQAGLNTFLFGQAATLLGRDVAVMGVFGGMALLALVLFWKEIKLLAFDQDYAASLGFDVQKIEALVTGLLVVAIVIGLQAVGVVLMSAMVVAPAAAARQWTDRLGRMVVLAAGFGAFSGVVGAAISSSGQGLSTGPVIVLVASGLVLFSLLLAPRRGVLAVWVQQRRTQQRYQGEQALASLYLLAIQHDNPQYPHPIGALKVMQPNQVLQKTLKTLERSGLVRKALDDEWALTPKGVEYAQTLVDPQSIAALKGTHHHHTNKPQTMDAGKGSPHDRHTN